MIKYNLASDSWGLAERWAILKVMISGRYTMGPKVASFEKEFAEKLKTKESIMVNSGSSANLIGFAAMFYKYNLQPGDEVIVPAISWSTSYYPITQLGMIPVFCDVDLNTFNIDTAVIQDAITPKTKAILAVNLLGNPCDLTYLENICCLYNIHLIEDNCESLGAKHESQYAGTYGLFGTHSFFFSHHLQTMEGGMIITDNSELAEYCRSLRAHGWTRDLKTNLLYKKTGNPFDDSYQFILPGYNVRPIEMSGAIGSVQLKKMDKFISARLDNANIFINRFEKISSSCIIQKVSILCRSSWFGFGVVLTGNLKGKRKEIIQALSENQIETRPIVAGNFTKQSVMKYLNARISGELHNSRYIDENGFFFGNDHRDLETQINRTADIIEKFI